MNLFNALGEVFLFAIAILLAAAIICGIFHSTRRVIRRLRSKYYSFDYKPRKITTLYVMRYHVAIYDICCALIDVGILDKNNPNIKEFFDAVDGLWKNIMFMFRNHWYAALPPHEAAVMDLIRVMRFVTDGSYNEEVLKMDINYTPGETRAAKMMFDYAEDTNWKFCDLWLEDKDQYYDEEGEEEDDTGGISGDKS